MKAKDELIGGSAGEEKDLLVNTNRGIAEYLSISKSIVRKTNLKDVANFRLNSFGLGVVPHRWTRPTVRKAQGRRFMATAAASSWAAMSLLRFAFTRHCVHR